MRLKYMHGDWASFQQYCKGLHVEVKMRLSEITHCGQYTMMDVLTLRCQK